MSSFMKKCCVIGLLILASSSVILTGCSGQKQALHRSETYTIATETDNMPTIEALVEECRSATEKKFPIFSSTEYDPEHKQLTIAVCVEGVDLAAKTLISDSTADFTEWNVFTCDAEDYCALWQGKFDSAGLSDVAVVVHFLNPSNYQKALITAARGKLLYDCVDEYIKSAYSGSVEQEITKGKQNALKSAQSYLKVSSFSYSRLVDQLEYEGYTEAEAYYAVDHCGANWYEQAAKSAAAYLRSSSFSRSRLIEQLEYEGFTHDQAVYGVEQNGY